MHPFHRTELLVGRPGFAALQGGLGDDEIFDVVGEAAALVVPSSFEVRSQYA